MSDKRNQELTALALRFEKNRNDTVGALLGDDLHMYAAVCELVSLRSDLKKLEQSLSNTDISTLGLQQRIEELLA